MSKVKVRSYCSPTLVLLAFDWDDGVNHEDFLGFSIRREPGFGKDRKPGFLFNKVDFDPPKKGKQVKGSNEAPIQKFNWWDSGIDTEDRGQRFRYTVTPVLGTGKNDLHPVDADANTVVVRIPNLVEDGVGIYFNRAVVSSQAFSSHFGKNPQGATLAHAMTWLSNGLAEAIPRFIADQRRLDGAIYHLTDAHWVMPALIAAKPRGSLVYYFKAPPKNPRPGGKTHGKGDPADLPAVQELARHAPELDCRERTKSNIMHDKFLVRYEGETPSAVLMGSANFTPEGLTCQANVVHTFESPDLAALYAARQEYLANNPTLPATREACTGWSRPVRAGGASIRAFFPPETARQSIDEVVKAVKHARSSVIFCLFSPTDKALLEALLAVGDDQKLMFGLLNSIQEPGRKKKGKVTEAQQEDQAQHPSPAAQVQAEVFHRSREDKKVVSYDLFGAKTAPRGWLPEFSTIDTSSYSTLKKAVQGAGAGTRQPPAVHIHHKFIVVDAESSNPVIFTGSANMSNNSVANNDENLLEIRDAPALAQAYFAEFMRLYEHYRARALWDWTHTTSSSSRKAGAKAEADTFVLKTSRDQWVKGAYREGTNEYFIRRELASPPR